MSTNTLIQKAIDLVRQIPVRANTVDPLSCHRLDALDALHRAIKVLEPPDMPTTTPTYSEGSLKPKAPNVALMSLLEEIEEIFDNTCLAAEACPCSPEDVLHRLEKVKKHLKKACASLEQYEAFFRYFEPGE